MLDSEAHDDFKEEEFDRLHLGRVRLLPAHVSLFQDVTCNFGVTDEETCHLEKEWSVLMKWVKQRHNFHPA